MTTLAITNSTIIGNFILATASFLILLVLIRVFAWKNIVEIFEKRETKIATDIDEAEKKRQEAEQLVNQRELELAQTRLEGKKLIQDAMERAKAEKRHILAQADIEVQALKDKAEKEILADKREAQEGLKVQVANLAVDLAGKIILEDLDQQAHSDLIDRYLDRLGDN